MATTRTYLALVPIDGPGLELGPALQPFVIADEIRLPGTLKGPKALPAIAGALFLDTGTGILYQRDTTISEAGEIERYGQMATGVYGADVVAWLRSAETVEVEFPHSEAPEILARCLAGEDEDIAAMAATLASQRRASLTPTILTLTPATLIRAVVLAIREVGERNARLLAPADPAVPHPDFRPPLTVPVEEAWTLQRIFGHRQRWGGKIPHRRCA